MLIRWARFWSFITTLGLLAGLVFPVSALADESVNPAATILISAVKTDGGSGTEYIELFNLSANRVSLADWKLEYIRSETGLSTEVCSSVNWSEQSQISKHIDLDLFDQSIDPLTRLKIFLSGMNDDVSGAVRLSQISGPSEAQQFIIHDLVGWGSDGQDAPCAEISPASISVDKQRLERCVDEAGIFVDTNDNSKDFIVLGDGQIEPKTCPSADLPNTPITDCSGVVVTEILPNPAGDDSANEFIEIHNPTDEDIDLFGCSLQIEGSDKVYKFSNDDLLEANKYLAIYSDVSGLRLPNAAGGAVLLVSGNQEFAFSYQGGLKDDISWAVIKNIWQATDQITPNAANLPMTPKPVTQKPSDQLKPCPAGKYRNPETNRCRNIDTSVSSLKPCMEGQERNSATNRCRSIVATLASLVPCRDGQERNPETNRCRSVLASSSKLTPCKQGQERNPETNRCRSVKGATSELKPCAEGQERNPETNRCRKVNAQLASADFDQDTDDSSPINYGVLAAVGSLVIGYALYEYRHDARNKWQVIKNSKFFKRGGE